MPPVPVRAPFLFVLLLLAASASCISLPTSARERLIGTWVFDPASLERTPGYELLSAEQRERLAREARQLQTELVFTRDRMRIVQGEKVDDRTYEVVSEDGDRLILQARGDDGSVRRAYVELPDEDHLVFDLGTGRVGYVRR